ncbi:MAG TPA: type II toxin-antitoxin system VapC family toxin [Dongiaceae bacterium]|nr:type II toxin-antitoxin system VapC family toxin [Dongiaceae bacterium]
MSCFPDTSFLCAIYRRQDNSAVAAAFFQSLRQPLPVSGLLLYEFRQSTRLQIWLHGQNARKGFPEEQGKQALADLDSDLEGGVVELMPVDWLEVLRLAERLSAAHTKTGGHRAMDILHVATALVLSAESFLTFDANQRKLARAEGMKASP